MDLTTAIDQLNEQEDTLLAELEKVRSSRDVLLALVKKEKKATKHVAAARARASSEQPKKKKKSDETLKWPIARALVKEDAPMTLDAIATQAGVGGKYPNRTAAVVLGLMAKQDLVKKRADGTYSAKAKLARLIESSSSNGSSGHGAEA